MSKQEKFDMKNRFGYDPGEFYDEAIDEQRKLLQESRQLADNISEAFGTTGTGGGAGTGVTGTTGTAGMPKVKYDPADVNQSGYVTPREQRAAERKQRKEDQERRARERAERSAEVGASERERQKQREQRMTERERAAGLTGTTAGRAISGTSADEKKAAESAKDTDAELKEQTKILTTIKEEIQKNP
jgi:hypothetical protein